MKTSNTWHIYTGTGTPNLPFPPAPPWRTFTEEAERDRGKYFLATDPEAIELVNAALYLRRPLLITGKPGIGKTTLAHAVANELMLGKVLLWSITTRSTLQDGIYHYDAIARLQDTSLLQSQSKDSTNNPNPAPPDIGQYIRLGPLGTALALSKPNKPRVLLIDEIDKSDIDLPNDLLHIFEEGKFEIKEISRLRQDPAYRTITVLTEDGTLYGIEREEKHLWRGLVCCEAFPFVILTSNGEREFPPAFLRRCLRLEMKPPTSVEQLEAIVQRRLQLTDTQLTQVKGIIKTFFTRQNKEDLATDQLLNAVY